jgi:hypothetical protein
MISISSETDLHDKQFEEELCIAMADDRDCRPDNLRLLKPALNAAGIPWDQSTRRKVHISGRG